MIGERLKELRSTRKLTMLQIAEDIGTTQMTYSRYERNIIDVSTEMLSKFADYYNVSVDYLLGREKPASLDTLISLAGRDNYERAFIRSFMEISDNARNELVQAIKTAVYNADNSDIDDLTSDNIVIIPLHIGKVSAGDGFELPDDDTMADVECYANEHTGDANYILQVSGDSMLPKFMDGEYILVKSTQALDLGDIGVFAFRGKGYIKQYKGTYIHSLNPDYPDIHPTADSNIDILGKVLGTVEIRHK